MRSAGWCRCGDRRHPLYHRTAPCGWLNFGFLHPDGRTMSHSMQEAKPVQGETSTASCTMISLVVRSYARRISSNLTIVIRSDGRYRHSGSFCRTAGSEIEVEVIQARLTGPYRFLDKQGIGTVLVRVSGGAGEIMSDAVVDIVASDGLSNGGAVVEAARSPYLSAIVPRRWVVVADNDVVLEGKGTTRASDSCAFDVDDGWRVADNRIVR